MKASSPDISHALEGGGPRRDGPAGGRRGDSAEAVYRAIYDAVLNQRLPPGTRLPEVSLGRLFGVSRSVVRRALSQLQTTHVVERRPNQMATVARPTVEETRHIFEARRLVEAEVVRQMAGRLPAEAAGELRALVERERAAHEGGRHGERVNHSMGYHGTLARHCPNPVLGEMLNQLVIRTSIVTALYKLPGMSACYLGDDHGAILELLQRGRGEQAAAAVRAHLERLERRLDLSGTDGEVDLAAILGGA